MRLQTLALLYCSDFPIPPPPRSAPRLTFGEGRRRRVDVVGGSLARVHALRHVAGAAARMDCGSSPRQSVLPGRIEDGGVGSRQAPGDAAGRGRGLQAGPMPSSFRAFRCAIFSFVARGRSTARNQSAPALALAMG